MLTFICYIAELCVTLRIDKKNRTFLAYKKVQQNTQNLIYNDFNTILFTILILTSLCTRRVVATECLSATWITYAFSFFLKLKYSQHGNFIDLKLFVEFFFYILSVE